jgi:S1-C subfamily serine protease
VVVEGRRVTAGDLIQAVNGHPVEDWDSLLDAVEALPLGSTVTLEIRREGRNLHLPVRLEATRE